MKRKQISENKKLMTERDWDKNNADGLSPYSFTFGSQVKTWWKCSKGHSWKATIKSRAYNGRGCPFCAGNKVICGYNDLQTLFPNVAKYWDYEKNDGLKPSQISAKSKKVAWWKCDKGHSYDMSVDKKTLRGFKCPICSNYRIVAGINDLATTNPNLVVEWNKEKNGTLLPQKIGKNSMKKIWRICTRGHERTATPHDRTQDNTGCPICSARRSTSFPEQAIYFYLKKLYPDTINRYKDIFDNSMELDVYIPSLRLGIEFDGKAFHNTEDQHKRELIKYEICKQKKIYLIRIKESQNDGWKDTADDVHFIPKERNYERLSYLLQFLLDSLDTRRQLFFDLEQKHISDVYLPHQSSVKVDLEKDRAEILTYLTDIPNSITNTKPDMAKEWDYEKNKPLTPNMFSIGSNEKVWWVCTVCGKSYKKGINDKNIKNSRVCPECAKAKRGRSFTLGVVKKVGSLRQTHFKLALEFHPTKNGDLTPDNITAGKFKSVWWKCLKCGFERKASPNSRKTGIGCPHCSGRVPMPGVDDLLTINPDLCKEWNYSKNLILPSEVLPGSSKKVWWICSKCGHEWETTIRVRKLHGCPKCNHRKRK